MSSLGGSLWLVPDPESKCAKDLQARIQSLSEDAGWADGVSKPFSPHMTITSSITDYFLSSVPKVHFPGYCFVHLDEVQLAQPELKIKEIVFGDLYYKRIFIRLVKTSSLLKVVSTFRSQFVGESQDSLDEFMENFDPHISLAYAEGYSGSIEERQILKASLEEWSKGLDLEDFKFMVLMDTRSEAATKTGNQVLQWKACPIRLAL